MTSRRKFIRGAGAAAAGFQIIPSRLLAQGPSTQVNVAAIGAGGRAEADIAGVVGAGANIVSLCDVDVNRSMKKREQFPQAKFYTDWREMLEKEADNIDAVTVATPDHTHAVAAMAAIKLGKHVYVEKPLTRTISEARALKEAAAEAGVCTQMGNQGHAANGARLTNEWIQSGSIGEVTEVHTRTNRPIWPQGMMRPEPSEPPESLNWDLWLGPVPFKPYGKDIAPFKWRGFLDYGTGALGDMGAHILDHPVWALGLDVPTSIEAVRVNRNVPGSEKDTHPNSCELVYHFPAKGDRPAVKLVWYDGKFEIPTNERMKGGAKPPGNGCVYYGKDHVMQHGSHGGNPSIMSKNAGDHVKPEQTMERSPGHHKEWVEAIKANDPSMAKSNFDYAAPLTELMLLGVIASVIGEGTKLTWDPETMKTGNADADKLVHHVYRDGWSL
ncbi:MAG: putative dehydrogenase [Verrucomicrobiales bacterium]|jgi:predicted dehydrogenase